MRIDAARLFFLALSQFFRAERRNTDSETSVECKLKIFQRHQKSYHCQSGRSQTISDKNSLQHYHDSLCQHTNQRQSKIFGKQPWYTLAGKFTFLSSYFCISFTHFLSSPFFLFCFPIPAACFFLRLLFVQGALIFRTYLCYPYFTGITRGFTLLRKVDFA